jgi:hypothetical protein
MTAPARRTDPGRHSSIDSHLNRGARFNVTDFMVGGANVAKGVIRVASWSALSMAAAAGIGAVFGTVV